MAIIRQPEDNQEESDSEIKLSDILPDEKAAKSSALKEMERTQKALALEIMGKCRYFRIKNWMDSLYMTEAPVPGGRVDLMVIDLRTYCVYGYEIKTSRSDFVSDDKWTSYTPFFNYFYFATPPGIIKKTELPDEVGLLEFSGTGNNKRLYQAKKALEIQPMFVRDLGERHLLNTLLQYMRTFNWRSERKLSVSCHKCGAYTPCADPRGLPFGVYNVEDEAERNARAIQILRETTQNMEGE
jgi:hypothetical protein